MGSDKLLAGAGGEWWCYFQKLGACGERRDPIVAKLQLRLVRYPSRDDMLGVGHLSLKSELEAEESQSWHGEDIDDLKA